MDYKDKIRKLLALAKSPEPEEAKFALLKARKLMAEHNLHSQKTAAELLPGVRPPVEENKKGGRNVNGVIRGRCPRCGGKIIYSEFYQNARDYTIRKDGKVPKRYVSRSGELSESVAACENGCGAYWEDEDFSIGQDGMFYDNKYTEDGQA